MIVTNNCLTLKEIQSLLLPQTKQSTSTICWTIKAIGFTQKRTKPVVVARNEDGVIELRATYSHILWPIQDDKLIFVDKSGFNLHLAPHYGYAPRRLDPHVTVPTQQGINLSLLMAIGIDGIVCWELHCGQYNSDLFSQWCRHKLF